MTMPFDTYGLFGGGPTPIKRRPGLLEGGAAAVPDASRIQYGPGDQGLLAMGGSIAKQVGHAGAQLAPAAWHAVKQDPMGSARAVAKFAGEELSGYKDLVERLPEAIRNRDLGGAGMAALSALPIVGAAGDGMRALKIAEAIPELKQAGKFDDLARQALAGGFTINPRGAAPITDGLSVGAFPHLTQVVPASEFTPAHLENFMARHRELFDNNPDVHLGAWREGDNVWIDPVKVLPANQRTQAIELGRQANQKSIADLNEISKGNFDNAFIDTGGTGESPQTIVERAAARVPAQAPSITDTDAAAARAGLLGPTVPPNSVHQAPQHSLLRSMPQTAPTKARIQGLERAANKALRTPSFDEAINVGKQVQAERWYDTDRLQAMWNEELGPEKGPEAYRRFAQMVAATSPGAQVPINIRRASREYMLDQRGLLGAELAQGGHRPIPGPYAARYQATNNGVLRGLLNHGEIQSDKAASFAENLTGNAAPATIDRHFLRAFNDALPKSSKFKITGDAPSALEYGALERAFKSRADELGMTPAEMQAAWWVGKGGETNMLSGSASFEEHFAQRVLTTAKELKMDTPEGRRKVAGMFIRGEIPLLGIGGAAAVGATQKAPNQNGQGPRGLLN